jgi:hypothetical protein
LRGDLIMLHIKHEILTYKPYRIVCDHCGWVSESYEKLSEVSPVMTAHLKARHTPPKQPRHAPKKPSEVVDNVRKIR